MATRLDEALLTSGVRLTRISLRVFGFRRTIRLLGGLTQITGSPATTDDVKQWVDVTNRAARRRFGASCLDRSVFLWFLMQRRQLNAAVRIGITIDGDAARWSCVGRERRCRRQRRP